MSQATEDFEYSLPRFARILTPFFVINLISSAMLLLQPFAIPIFLAEFCLLALLTAWLWFPFPERWMVAGATWLATILFSWAVILPLRAVKKLGLGLYRGRVQLGV